MSDETNILGRQLRHFREKLRLRQAEMAQRLGVSASLYTKLETGQIGTTARRIEKFASVLQTSVAFLTTGEGPELVEAYSAVTLGAEELRALSLNALERLITLSQDAKLLALAEQVAPTLRVPPQRALAVVIRTILLGN